LRGRGGGLTGLLRLTKDGKPDFGTTYDIGDSGPTGVDQRKVVDPSFLGHMLPEQAWAPDFPPAGQPGFPPGEGTLSATPLAWSHAQFVRLAWSIQAGQPVERPSVVACRYAGCP
jgi:hypothetical protein